MNPMAALLDAYRDVLLFSRWPAWPPLLVAILTSTLGLFAAYAYFKRAEWEFADRS
jgi:ABC-type polysaccharide/polyol phosphate export permease